MESFELYYKTNNGGYCGLELKDTFKNTVLNFKL